MTARPAGATAVAAAVATALLVVVLAGWAASIGPGDVLTGSRPSSVTTPSRRPTPPPPATTGHQQVRHQQAHHAFHPPAWVRALGLLLKLAVALLVAWLLLRYAVVPALRWRPRRRRPEADTGFEVVEPSRAVAEAMLEDADAQRRELLEGASPDDAVVACWHRFETQAAAAGVARHPWETSSEYTMRVLDLVDAHQPAVTRLGALYREARFSEHQLTEAHRQEALDALDAIHRTIGIPA